MGDGEARKVGLANLLKGAGEVHEVELLVEDEQHVNRLHVGNGRGLGGCHGRDEMGSEGMVGCLGDAIPSKRLLGEMQLLVSRDRQEQ